MVAISKGVVEEIDHYETKHWPDGETIKMLRSLPRLGHAGRKEGTRELNVPRLPFVIVYRIDREAYGSIVGPDCAP